jgi:hypothetical protein
LFANAIQDTAGFHVDSLTQSMSALSEIITTSKGPTDVFPFVTVANFELYGQQVRLQSGLEALAWSPLVSTYQESAWISYSMKHADWLQVSRDILFNNRNPIYNVTSSPLNYVNGSVAPAMYTIDANGTTVNSTGPFLPLWQLSPPPFKPSLVNYDISQADWCVALCPRLALAGGDLLLTNVQDLSTLAGTAIEANDHVGFHRKYVSDVSLADAYLHPHSLIVAPVYNDLKLRQDMMGVVVGIAAWDRYLYGLLPDGVSGIVVVLNNTCGQSYTYTLDGNMVRVCNE